MTLESMASSFGVTVAFIDREVSRFVAAGRLNCKIDKVSGIIETTRPDHRNAQYQEIVKKVRVQVWAETRGEIGCARLFGMCTAA